MNNQKIFLKSCLLVCILFMLSMAVFSQSRIAFYNFNARSNPHTVTLIDAILTDGELKQDIGIAGPTSEYEYRCSFLNATGLVIKSVNIKTPFEINPANCPNGQFSGGNLTIRTQYDPNAVKLIIEHPYTHDPSQYFEFTSIDLTTLTYNSRNPIFPTTKVMNMGLNNEKINFVIMGDGYTESELTKYISDAENIREALFSFSPFKELRSYFNVFRINVQSNESGATAGNPNNPVTTKVDNYFGSTFYLSCNSLLEELLGPTKKGKVRRVLQNHVPEYDLGIIIVNSTQYGGSGGQPEGITEESFPTCSMGTESVKILLHEIAHGFAGLRDEYWPGTEFAFEAPNLTQNNNLDTVVWKQYLGYENINIFNVVGATGWYRPSEECIMFHFDYDFCLVCRDTIKMKILNILDLDNICGDVNKDTNVNIIDALITAQKYVGLMSGPYNYCYSDVDGNGFVDILDALMLAQYDVGLRPELSECLDCTLPTGDYIQITKIDPYISCDVGFGEHVNIAFDYNIASINGAKVGITITDNDNLINGVGFSGSPIFTGRGSNTVYFVVNYSAPVHADRIRLTLQNPTDNSILSDTYLAVNYTFKSDVIRITDIDPISGDIGWNENVRVKFDYYVNQQGGAKASCIPLRGSTQISETTIFDSPMYTWQGSDTGYFSINLNTISSDTIQIMLGNTDLSTIYDSDYANADFNFKKNTVRVISSNPPGGSLVALNDRVEVTFNYTMNENTGVTFKCYPYSQGSYVKYYYTEESGPYTGQGTATVKFSATTNPVFIDQIRVVMLDSGNNTIAETYSNAYYNFK